MVEYSPGYEADHWCAKGHVILCLEGELETRLADRRTFTLKPGMSYHVGDGDPPHRSVTEDGRDVVHRRLILFISYSEPLCPHQYFPRCTSTGAIPRFVRFKNR